MLTQEDEERINALPFTLPDIVLIKKIHTDKKGPKQQGQKKKGQKQGEKLKGQQQKDKGEVKGSDKGKKQQKQRKVPREKKNGGGGEGGGEGSGGGGDQEEEMEYMVEEEGLSASEAAVKGVSQGASESGVKGGAEGGVKGSGNVRSHSTFGEYDDDDEQAYEEFLLDINDDDDDDEEDDEDDDEEEEEDDDDDDGGSDEEEEVSIYILSFSPHLPFFVIFRLSHRFSPRHTSHSNPTFNHTFDLTSKRNVNPTSNPARLLPHPTCHKHFINEDEDIDIKTEMVSEAQKGKVAIVKTKKGQEEGAVAAVEYRAAEAT